MPAAQWPRRMVRLGLLGVAAMTLAVTWVLLERGTTGHDWYSARKLTVAEVMLAVGFRKTAIVAYRTADGDTWNIIRAAVAELPSAERARRRILATVGDGVMLGAGVGGTVFCLMLLGAASHWRRGRTGTTPEPVEHSLRHPSASCPTERIEDWHRPGLRARVALLLVSPADLERLLAPPGPTRRPGFVDLPEPDGVEAMETDGGMLELMETRSLPPPTRAAGLPAPERAEPALRAAVAAKPAAAGSGSSSDANKRDGTAGDKAAGPRRNPGEEFF